jgi:peptidylprolyl isomerase
VKGRTLALSLCAALAVAACDDDDSSGDSATTTTAAGLTKPDVKVPGGPPPKDLVIEEASEGSGATAQAGDVVTVQYVGVDYETGREFDASWDRGEPFIFQLGAGQVIPGWDEGLEGMQVGARRELIIPPDLAYGRQGQPPAIGPDATLVFVIDLLAVE